MKRGQVWVRAKDANGEWGTADVLDLDEVSFRAFVIDVLMRVGLVTAHKCEFCDGEEIDLIASAVE